MHATHFVRMCAVLVLRAIRRVAEGLLAVGELAFIRLQKCAAYISFIKSVSYAQNTHFFSSVRTQMSLEVLETTVGLLTSLKDSFAAGLSKRALHSAASDF